MPREEIDIPGVKKLANFNGDYVLALQRDESAARAPALAEDRVAVARTLHAELSSLRRRRLPPGDGLPAGAAAALVAADAGDRRAARDRRAHRGRRARARDRVAAASSARRRRPACQSGRRAVRGRRRRAVLRAPVPVPSRHAYRVLVHHSLVDALDGQRPREPESFELEDFVALTVSVPRRRRPRDDPGRRDLPHRDELPRNQLRLYVDFSAPMSEGVVARHVYVRREPTPASRSTARSSRWSPSSGTANAGGSPCCSIRRASSGASRRTRRSGTRCPRASTVEVVGRRRLPRRRRPSPRSRRATRRYAGRPGRPAPRSTPTSGSSRSRRPGRAIRWSSPSTGRSTTRCSGTASPSATDGGRAVAGDATVGAGETAWSFTPDAGWAAGTYELVVDSILEDLAGNSVARGLRPRARPRRPHAGIRRPVHPAVHRLLIDSMVGARPASADPARR